MIHLDLSFLFKKRLRKSLWVRGTLRIFLCGLKLSIFINVDNVTMQGTSIWGVFIEDPLHIIITKNTYIVCMIVQSFCMSQDFSYCHWLYNMNISGQCNAIFTGELPRGSSFFVHNFWQEGMQKRGISGVMPENGDK